MTCEKMLKIFLFFFAVASGFGSYASGFHAPHKGNEFSSGRKCSLNNSSDPAYGRNGLAYGWNDPGPDGKELWYDHPALNWESEALPVGNGRMGAMLFGGVTTDRIQFNEQSLWSGDNNWDGEYDTGDHGFGSYRNFGELTIDFNAPLSSGWHDDTLASYRRSLNIFTGIHKTVFKSNGIGITREAFASNPDQVMVFQYTADRKGAFTGKIMLTSGQGAAARNGNIPGAAELRFEGEMLNHLKYAACLRLVHAGGVVRLEGDHLVFEGCNSLTLYLDARTNYKPDYQSGWRGADPFPVIEKEMTMALSKGYSALKDRHRKDFTGLSQAALIDIGKTADSILALPTDIRLKKYAAGGNDPDLEETIFQYGRYLLISCSRPGGLPANLQGLWNNSNSPAWASDYHNNINIQMNYWGAESTNLSACQIPLIGFILAAQEPCRIATKKAFGEHTRGWTARTSQNIFGGNGWEWNIPASAWYAQHVFEHWAFTGDKTYLKDTAYPVLKEICQFWEDRLQKTPEGLLIVPKGWSPEHGPREDGTTYDQQIIRDLFQNYLDAAKAMEEVQWIDKDIAFEKRIADMQQHLAPDKIGKWGQLQEWQEDRDDPDDQHRHTSHLFGVYPGRQINNLTTPDLARAAIISLRSRSGNYGKNINAPFAVASTVGDSRRSWTWPWRCALWARLGDGEKAGIMVRGLLTYNMLSNLFANHPPFQLDGNFGISGAMAEMLLQSQTGVIQLLPAIPANWAADGSFSGLKARGGFTVDCRWHEGKVTAYRIRSARPVKIKVSVNGELKDEMSVNMGRVYDSHFRIGNPFLSVQFDPVTKVLEASARAGNKIFLRNIIPNGVTGTAVKEQVFSPVFGKGDALVIPAVEGGSISFTLYQTQPFLFVTQAIRNTSSENVDFQKLSPLTFSVDLGKSASELKTLGTGGLLDPDKNPGSYVFLTTVDPATRNGVVTGWLTNEKGSGVLFSDVKNDQIEIKAQIDYGHLLLPVGKREVTETLLIGYFDDARLGEEQFADAIAKQQNIQLKPRSAVYCTWYSEKNGGAGSEGSSIELAKFIRDSLQQFGLGVIQIDDQWQAGGQYNGPHRGFDRVDPKGGYPNGMTNTTNGIKKEGLTAGIWWMPFARNHQDPEYKDRQQWFAQRKNGKPFETAWGGTSLDLTNPSVQNHIAYVARTLHDWGFDYFKMDGLWTGTVTEQVYINDGYKNDSIGNCKLLHNPFKTQIEAFRDGLRILRRGAGDGVFFSGCCVSQNMRSFGASIGLVNSMRIGPDFNHDGQSIRTGAIRASRLYFLNGRVWWNDPDPSMLRESGHSTADGASAGIGSLTRARLLPSFVAVSGQFFLSSDWLPDLPNDRIEIMKRCMASHHGIARPVDAFDKALPSIWLATDSKSGTPRKVIGLFNWDTAALHIGCTLSRAGLDDKKIYHAFDFWGNKALADISDSIAGDLPSESCRIIAVRAKSDHPIVVSTSEHVTQGMIDLLNEKWESNTLSGTSKLIGGDDYELRVAGLHDGGEWKIEDARIVDNPGGVKIAVLPQTEEGWVRIVIKSSGSQVVKWRLRFRNQIK
jgi:glycosyl hydrolase family 95/glycosyl hydrolase family 65